MDKQTRIKLYTLLCHKNSIIKAIRQYCHGFSLVSSLVSLGIVGLIMSALISLLSIQQKDGRSIEQQLASASLKYHTLQMLRYKENCHCQFQSLPSIKGKSELSLTSLKSDCSPTAETIAETGKDIWAHTKISSIKVTKITPGRLINGKNNNGEPDPSQNKKEYQAQLSIRFDQATQYRPMRDIELPIMFTAWDGSGNIIHCGASTDHDSRLTSMNYRLRNTIYTSGGLLEKYDSMVVQADTNRGNIDENANTIRENDNSILQANTAIEANRILIASKQSKPHSHPLALSGHNHNFPITTQEPPIIEEEEPTAGSTEEEEPSPPEKFCLSGTDYCMSTTRYYCNKENGQIALRQNSVNCGFKGPLVKHATSGHPRVLLPRCKNSYTNMGYSAITDFKRWYDPIGCHTNGKPAKDKECASARCVPPPDPPPPW